MRQRDVLEVREVRIGPVVQPGHRRRQLTPQRLNRGSQRVRVHYPDAVVYPHRARVRGGEAAPDSVERGQGHGRGDQKFREGNLVLGGSQRRHPVVVCHHGPYGHPVELEHPQRRRHHRLLLAPAAVRAHRVPAAPVGGPGAFPGAPALEVIGAEVRDDGADAVCERGRTVQPHRHGPRE